MHRTVAPSRGFFDKPPTAGFPSCGSRELPMSTGSGTRFVRREGSEDIMLEAKAEGR